MKFIKLFSIVATAIFLGALFIEYDSMVSKPKYIISNDLPTFDKLPDQSIQKLYNWNQAALEVHKPDSSMQTFWIKVIFSGILCLAALYVVLTRKYDDETKKWAVSVLTLIAGVWIGTATK